MSAEGGPHFGLIETILGFISAAVLGLIGWGFRLSLKVAEHGRDIEHSTKAFDKLDKKLDGLDEKFDELITKLGDVLSRRTR